ncbi:helix-turn-helix transcriptional regulator, partial [Clostridioides difficile]|nr:helix-turn-helix transcriptional regulator [Clostridioides difficile]
MINENLKSLRKINQYTQEELAEKLNVSRQSIAKWE